MPQEGGNGAFRMIAHGQPTGKGMPQGVPGHIFQASGFHGWKIHPSIKVPWVQVCGWILTREDPLRPPLLFVGDSLCFCNSGLRIQVNTLFGEEPPI